MPVRTCNRRVLRARPQLQDNQLCDCAEAVEFAWGSDLARLEPPFDLVLAADVAYSSASLPALLQSLAAAAEGAAEVWYAFEDRPPVTDEALRLMPQYGLTAAVVSPERSIPL